jgi:hypothetical protein
VRRSRRAGAGLAVVLVSFVCLLMIGSGAGSFSQGFASAGPSGRTLCQGNCAATALGPSPSGIVSDLTVTASSATSFAGSSILFQAALPTGLTATGFTWWWGNGNVTSTTTGSVSYTYPGAGDYLVYVQATDSAGAVHDNLHGLLYHTVLPSATGDDLGNYAELAGSITANTTANVNATGAIAPGGFLSVETWITSTPSNPGWSLGTPHYAVSANGQSYATLSTGVLNATGINGVSVSFASDTPNGSYSLEFSLSSTGPENGTTATVWANFTYTTFVELGAQVPASPLPTSPHPGTVDEYTAVNFYSWDPALSYNTYDVAVLQNVFQTLIFRNVSQDGSVPQDFVPDLAMCVPGSALCQSLYGSSLIDGQGDYTFVLNPNASFYDPSTGAHWTVFPNDVAFSVARDCLEANVGYPSIDFPGWDLCQTILPGASTGANPANQSWDAGTHYPYNNTPANILAGVLVNDSAFCPASSPMRDGIHGDGCVTFVTSRSGQTWPQFLAFLSMPEGSGVVSCSILSSLALGLPGWSAGSSCIGAPPGTDGNPNGVPGDFAWDSYINTTASTEFGSPIEYSPVGSGPYYVADVAPAHPAPSNLSYIDFHANPYWGGTPCLGGRLAGCLPAGDLGGQPPDYIASVQVYNNASDNATPGEQALASGAADLADVSSIPTLVADVDDGLARVVEAPSISVLALMMNMLYSPSAASTVLGTSSTLPAELLRDVNLRQFLINSFPWQPADQGACIEDGIQVCTQYAGIIPAYMTGYVPSNLTWPSPDASASASVVGSAGWWWAQAENDGVVGPSCSVASPCTFPMPLFPGGAGWNLSLNLWAQNVIQISGGAIRPLFSQNSTWGMVFGSAFSSPGNSPFAVQYAGWSPDIFDPSNYLGPFVGPEEYGAANNFSSLLQSQYESPCSGPAQDPQVTESCQGSAYQELLSLIAEGATCVAPTCSVAERELIYNEADHLSVSLGLLLPISQSTETYAIAPWIDPSSIVTDPMSADLTVLGEPLFDLRYVAVVPPVYPLEVSTLSGFSEESSPAGPSVALQLRAAALTLETGETLLILVGVAGGTGVYHYEWNGLPSGCISSDASAIVCRPNGTGTFSLQVNVTDTAGNRGSSPLASVTIQEGPTITDFAVAPAHSVLGSPVTFTTEATGGIGALSFAYEGLPLGCASANSSSVTCVPSAVGTFTVVAEVHDAIGVTAIATTSVNVTAAVTAPPPSPSSPSTYLELEYLGLGILVGAVATSVVFVVTRRRSRNQPPPMKGPPAPPM